MGNTPQNLNPWTMEQRDLNLEEYIDTQMAAREDDFLYEAIAEDPIAVVAFLSNLEQAYLDDRKYDNPITKFLQSYRELLEEQLEEEYESK